jgi:hypothetical protein
MKFPKKPRKPKKEIADIFDNVRIVFMSDAERWMAWWLQELKDRGVIVKWGYQDVATPLFPSVVRTDMVHGARKDKIHRRVLHRAHTYTADFSFVPNHDHPDTRRLVMRADHQSDMDNEAFINVRDGEDLTAPFIQISDLPVLVDVKGMDVTMQAMAQDRLFALKVCAVWHLGLQYVNKCVPDQKKGSSLFRQTFMPARYTLTECASKVRMAAHGLKLFKEWTTCQK